MEDIKTTSPIPEENKEEEMNFPEAMKKIITGNKVTKLEWNDRSVYGVLEDGFLMISKEDGKKYQWIISEGDLLGEDYILLT